MDMTLLFFYNKTTFQNDTLLRTSCTFYGHILRVTELKFTTATAKDIRKTQKTTIKIKALPHDPSPRHPSNGPRQAMIFHQSNTTKRSCQITYMGGWEAFFPMRGWQQQWQSILLKLA